MPPRASLTPIIPPRKLGVPLSSDIHTLSDPLTPASGSATPYTSQRRREYRAFPTTVQDQVQTIAAGMTLTYAQMQNTTERKNLLQLLTAIVEAVQEPDAKLREKIETLIFQECCARLNISHCLATDVLRLVNSCCRKSCSCFSSMLD